MAQLPEIKKKTQLELKSLTTPRLLAYYQAERKRFYQFEAKNNCKCTCGCGGYMWNILHKFDSAIRNLHTGWEEYLWTIQYILNSRENLSKKVR